MSAMDPVLQTVSHFRDPFTMEGRLGRSGSPARLDPAIWKEKNDRLFPARDIQPEKQDKLENLVSQVPLDQGTLKERSDKLLQAQVIEPLDKLEDHRGQAILKNQEQNDNLPLDSQRIGILGRLVNPLLHRRSDGQASPGLQGQVILRNQEQND
uniref:Uncharacterized protein n=1 Tax=Bursaphelenchus xylophilus TaxID=6326 RepID=A0A1I7SLK4_BURXY